MLMIEEVVSKIQIQWDWVVLVFHEMGCATSCSILTLEIVECSKTQHLGWWHVLSKHIR